MSNDVKQKVWLVATGEYSSYQVLGVFSSREKAEYAKRLWDSSNELEEYALDWTPPHPVGMRKFFVVMRRDGDVTRVLTQQPGDGFEGDQGSWSQPSLEFSIHVWAEDAQHAIKIANEKRAASIAAGQLPVSEDNN